MFVAEELRTFWIKTLKLPTLKTYSISKLSGRGPLKIRPWPTG